MTSYVVRRSFAGIIAVVVTVAHGGCGTASMRRSVQDVQAADHVSQTVAEKPVLPTTIQVQRPAHKTIERVIEQPGYAEAFAETPLYAKLAGYVEKLNVDIGDRVTGPRMDSDGHLISPGQVLAKLSVPEANDELAQKKALLVQSDCASNRLRRRSRWPRRSWPPGGRTSNRRRRKKNKP